MNESPEVIRSVKLTRPSPVIALAVFMQWETTNEHQ